MNIVIVEAAQKMATRHYPNDPFRQAAFIQMLIKRAENVPTMNKKSLQN